MIITISGNPGSGKSLIASILSKALNYKHISAGDLRGQMAIERGITIDELNKIGEIKPYTDKEIDLKIRKLGETQDNLVIDGRLAWHFIPQSFKVFLDVSELVGAHRIFRDNTRSDEKTYNNVQDVLEAVRERIASDKRRYSSYYQLEYDKKENYDLWIDTTMLTPKEVADIILKNIQNKGMGIPKSVKKQSKG